MVAWGLLKGIGVAMAMLGDAPKVMGRKTVRNDRDFRFGFYQ